MPQALENTILILILVVFGTGIYGATSDFVANPGDGTESLAGTLVIWLSLIGMAVLLVLFPGPTVRERMAAYRQGFRQNRALTYVLAATFPPILLVISVLIAWAVWTAGIPSLVSFTWQERGSLTFEVTHKTSDYDDAEFCDGEIRVDNKVSFPLNSICNVPAPVWNSLRVGDRVKLTGRIGWAGIRFDHICKVGSDDECISVP